MRDAELQRLYAQVMTRRDDGDEAKCVAPDKLLDLAERRGPEEERLELLDHVMACTDCQRELELLRSIVEAQPRARRWSARPLAIAASFVVLLGAAIVWQQMGDRAADVMRGPPDEVILVSPEGEVSVGETMTFIWRATEGAVEYEFELVDSEGSALLSQSTQDTILIIPSVGLSRGRAYRWWVRAVAADGSERASRLMEFENP